MAKIEIYVVTTLNPDKSLIEEAKTRICEKFGGLTIISNCEGLWLDSGKICADKVEIWRIVTNDIDAQFVNNIATSLREICGQKSQFYTIDDKPFFIEGKIQYCRVAHGYVNPKNCVGCTMC